jgi:hypothetical protein
VNAVAEVRWFLLNYALLNGYGFALGSGDLTTTTLMSHIPAVHVTETAMTRGQQQSQTRDGSA